MDRPLRRTHPRLGRDAAVRRSAGRRPLQLRPRAARLAACARLHSGGPAGRVEERGRPGARVRRRELRARRRGARAATSRGLPRRKRALDRRRAAFRGLRRLPQRPCDPGPVDAALGRPGVYDAAARRRPRRLRGFPRVRPARAAPAGGLANPAPHPLLGLARAALGRPRVPGRISLVQHPALLAGSNPRAEGAGRLDAGGTDSGLIRHVSLESSPPPSPSRRDAALTVTLVVFCQGFNMLSLGGIALFLPLIREDLRISFAQAGMLSAAATFTYPLGQIPRGYLADRLGPQRVVFIGILGSTLLSLNFGMIQSYPAALANQVVSGAFRALIFAPDRKSTRLNSSHLVISYAVFCLKK